MISSVARNDRSGSGLPFSIRPVLLIGFGVLLGWSGSTMLAFYGAAPSDEGMRAESRAAVERSPRSGAPPADPDSSPVAAAFPESLAGPAFDLFGGGTPAGRETVFCAVLIVDPAGCEAEASRRNAGALAEPAAAAATPGAAGLARDDEARRPLARPPARSRSPPVTTSSLARPKTVRDPFDP